MYARVLEKIFLTTLEGLRRYLRIDLHGLGHVPKRGKAIIAPNHSGCAGLDALMLTYLLIQETPRAPRVLALWGLLKKSRRLAAAAKGLGLQPASTEMGLSLLRKNNLVVCFPEGEKGSFKPTAKRYQLQPFQTGFIRMALKTGAPIVPCVIIGAEETTINLATLKLGSENKRDTLVPVPALLPPLPAKWDIHFFAPIDLSAHRDLADDKEKLRELAEGIRAQMQIAVDAELAARSYVYVNPQRSARV